MTGELEDTEHSKHSQGHKRPGNVIVVGDPQANVVRQDGHHVDDGHD